MIAEIYVEVDDFCQEEVGKISWLINRQSYFRTLHTKRTLKKRITISEIMTVLIYYPHSGYKNFNPDSYRDYYEKEVMKNWLKDFPDLVSYQRFVWWIPLALLPLMCFVMWRCCNGRRTGIYFIDSTKIGVGHDKRAHQNKVFKGFASWGKTSMGWFYGFKLHLLVNQYGELIHLHFTTGSVSDNNAKVLFHLTNDINGWLIGDKGYLCNQEKKEFVEKNGKISWFSKPRKNQKNQKIYFDKMPFMARLWVRKRGLIETVIGIKKKELDLEHTRHRSIFNAFTHMYAAIAAYYFRTEKPKTNIHLEPFLLAS